MRQMKDMAIVCNIGHFDNEIQVASLRNLQMDQHQAAGRCHRISPAQRIILLSQGRLVNLGNATGHPSFVMSASFTNQTLAQIELWQNRKASTRTRSMCCPSTLDEKVARLHLAKLGVKLTELKDEQAAYIGVPAGPLQARLLPLLTPLRRSGLTFQRSPQLLCPFTDSFSTQNPLVFQ